MLKEVKKYLGLGIILLLLSALASSLLYFVLTFDFQDYGNVVVFDVNNEIIYEFDEVDEIVSRENRRLTLKLQDGSDIQLSETDRVQYKKIVK